jgi:hypothetical protein
VARERWQCRCGSIQVPANWTTYPTSRRRDRGTYWYREYRTRQQERQASCCSLWGAALLRGCKRISRKTYPFVRLADACVYLTHPQEQSRSQPLPHTVLSRKNIPYRPTNVCSLRQAPDATTKLPTKDLQIMRFLRCLVSSKNIPYPATSFTVPRYKLYRTPLQALPYPATSFTVLTSKEYRTLPQNMTYPATKAARNVPAKLRKYVGERSERPVCVYC